MRHRRYRDFENEEIVKIGAKYHLLYHFGNYMSEVNALRGIKRWKATKSFFPAVVIQHPHRFKKKFMVYGGIGIGKPMTKKGYEKVASPKDWFVAHPSYIKHIVKK